MDPRLAIIEHRLAPVEKVIAVASGKGGVGKSTVATALALILLEQGHKVGLLDLDFYGPSTHIILGIEGLQPQEGKGLIPPEVHGLKVMSIIYYTGDRPAPLRGPDISNVLIELLAITRWGTLDYLIVDMPPGLGETTLETIRLLGKARFLLVTTPSRVARETVSKLVTLLMELNAPIIGVVENMVRASDAPELENSFQVPLLGKLPFDEDLEASLGNPNRLMKTIFAQKLKELVLYMPEFQTRH